VLEVKKRTWEKEGRKKFRKSEALRE